MRRGFLRLQAQATQQIAIRRFQIAEQLLPFPVVRDDKKNVHKC